MVREAVTMGAVHLRLRVPEMLHISQIEGGYSMPTNGFVQIIKAVGHEPLGFYSLVFLILGTICYRVVKKLGKPKPREVAVILAIILLGFSGVALAIIRADNKVSAQREEQQKPPGYTALIKFIGERSHLEPTQIAFRNSSGQVNFGCGESKTASVAWNAPAGADQINGSASWANTDNVKSQDQQVAYAGTSATANGSISGLDRNWLGNCPGGGHGELVLQGTYRILQPSAATPFESLQSGTVSAMKPLIIPLPTEQGTKIEACEATIIQDGSNSPVTLRVAPIPAMTSSDTLRSDARKFELAVSGKEAILSLSK
jgi:hypothetical protein